MVAAMMHRKQPTRTVQVCVCGGATHTLRGTDSGLGKNGNID